LVLVLRAVEMWEYNLLAECNSYVKHELSGGRIRSRRLGQETSILLQPGLGTTISRSFRL